MSARKKPERGKGRRGVPPDEVPPRFRRILSAVPVRNESQLEWETDEKGLVTITHAKDLKGWERWLMKKVGGSPIIRRKLDAPGSDIWMLCDGKHDVADICDRMDRKYRESVEPVLTRVTGFLEMLLARGLVMLEAPGRAAPAGKSGGPVRRPGKTGGDRR